MPFISPIAIKSVLLWRTPPGVPALGFQGGSAATKNYETNPRTGPENLDKSFVACHLAPASGRKTGSLHQETNPRLLLGRQHIADRRDVPAGLVAGEKECCPHLPVADFVAAVCEGDSGSEESDGLYGDGSLSSLILR
jgi:hypothetical protein